MNLRETHGKQAASMECINDDTDKRLTATKQSSPRHDSESTLPVTQRTPMKQVSPLETEQVYIYPSCSHRAVMIFLREVF